MMLDIGFVVLLVISVIIGYRRGFSLEFFNMFKFIFIIFITNYIYKYSLNSEKIKLHDQLDIFITVVTLQYILYSIILIVKGKFLKSIKINRFDRLLGAMSGMAKIFFVGIIIYIMIITGSLQSKRIRNIREKSIVIQYMTRYALDYSDSFPNFIKQDIEAYVAAKREKQVIDDVLKSFEEVRTEKAEDDRIINYTQLPSVTN